MRSRHRTLRPALAGLVAAVLVSPLQPASAAPGATARVSASASGDANGPSPATSVADTTSPQMALDGLKVAFSSDATNLVSGDTNGKADAFVRDLVTRKVQRVSVSSTERQANGASHSPAISVDGRYVAFVSEATNLVSGDTNGIPDVFLRDRVAGTTARVSVSGSGAQANGASRTPSISLFGDFVGFESEATNLAAGDDNGLGDAFVRAVRARSTFRLMPTSDDEQRILSTEHDDPTAVTRRTWTARPTISYDGRFVAFVRGTYERAPAVPSMLEVFIRDRVRRTYAKIEITPWMGAAKVLADKPMISADGRYVAFEAWSVLDSATGGDEALIRNPLDPKDVFVYDRVARTIGQVTFNSWFQPANGDSYSPSISAGGQYIAFVSEATNLVAGDTNGAPDVFVRDNVTRTTSRMSIGPGVAEAPAGGIRPSISYEGRNIAFASASGLARSDANGVADVYRRDRRTDTPNRPPDFQALANRTINNAEEHEVVLRASDPDRDPVRFGILHVSHGGSTGSDKPPPGATLDPPTGEFRWTPTPNQAGGWRFIFWVDDPRGAVDFLVWDVVVRNAEQTARCKIQSC